LRRLAGSIIKKMSKDRRLTLVLLLDLLLIVALVIVGLAAHSLGVLAAGVDYLGDGAAIGLSLFALRLSHRAVSDHLSRHPNPTDIAALVNAGWLLALNIGVVAAATRRLASGAAEVHGAPVLIVSTVAAGVMLLCTVIVRAGRDGHDPGEDLNLRAVSLDLASDAAAATGLAASGAVIMVTSDWYWLDPTVALIIAVVILYHGVHLISQVLTALRIPWRPAKKDAT
jgi:cobalt-zinc-cadmium efflux system protein